MNFLPALGRIAGDGSLGWEGRTMNWQDFFKPYRYLKGVPILPTGFGLAHRIFAGTI